MLEPVPSAPFSPRRPAAPSRPGERGYILALLLGFCAVMGILLMKGIPAVNTEVQREMEEELIFRGEQMAKAIRVYQARSGGYPTSLEDLTKVKPRLVREVALKDPMNKSGEWDFVYAVQAGASGETRGLPIVGVKSRIEKDSFKVYKGKTIYSDWVFLATDSLFGLPGSTPAGGGGRVGSPDSSTTSNTGGDKGGGNPSGDGRPTK